MATDRKTMGLILALMLLSWMLFLFQIETPLKLNFDEFHYIPAAKEFLSMGQNRNWEHPPLAKYLIAIGVAVFGDQPLGWRIMSTFAGAATLGGMAYVASLWFQTHAMILWIALLTLFNQLLFVQSRIAMLDTFMFVPMVWAIGLFWQSGQVKLPLKQREHALLGSGILMALATACKWFAVLSWGGFAFIQCAALMLSWNPARREIGWIKTILYLGIIPAAVYLATFIPLLFYQKESYGILDLFRMQWMIYDGQLRVVNAHNYMSQWWQWPLLNRPIWYAFDKEGTQGEFVRGVLLLGNPLIMWSGLLAIAYTLWDSIKRHSKLARWIVGLFLLFWLSWGIIPRKTLFYYYYYPAGMMLSFALAYTFDRLRLRKFQWFYLGAVAVIFVYFYPILAGMPIATESFRQWMWFDSWI